MPWIPVKTTTLLGFQSPLTGLEKISSSCGFEAPDILLWCQGVKQVEGRNNSKVLTPWKICDNDFSAKLVAVFFSVCTNEGRFTWQPKCLTMILGRGGRYMIQDSLSHKQANLNILLEITCFVGKWSSLNFYFMVRNGWEAAATHGLPWDSSFPDGCVLTPQPCPGFLHRFSAVVFRQRIEHPIALGQFKSIPFNTTAICIFYPIVEQPLSFQMWCMFPFTPPRCGLHHVWAVDRGQLGLDVLREKLERLRYVLKCWF